MIAQTHTEELTRHAAAESWLELAHILSGSREPGDVWLRTLAQNLQAIRTTRPTLYALLRDASSDIVPARERTSDASLVEAMADCEPSRRIGSAVAVAGAGDGSLIRTLAKFPPTLPLGRQQEVCVIEPDVGRLVEMLGATDLTGPRGPIVQERFAWYVGADWADSLAGDLTDQPTKIFPQQLLPGGEPRPDIDEGFRQISARLQLIDSSRAVAVNAYYESLGDAAQLAVLESQPPRRPRVLMLTSRFTAVLQYSTYDSADAFEKLGWDVLVLKEQEPWHAMSRQAIRAAVADFKPDLLFQIDHLRYESGDLVPPKLPFVCWIQDHLPNLTTSIAGASIGERDFVLTGGVYRYAGRYGYPRRQCIDMAKVSREPQRPATWRSDREDLLYVSHWSHTPESIIAETCARARDSSGPQAEAAMRACIAELTGVYSRGGSMRTDLEVRGLVRGVFTRRGEALTTEVERSFVDELFQRLNNAYYRQQALLWAGQIADDLGLKFGIYGAGWERHPQLCRWARGVVKYGPELESLTRESKILLQLEPYACFTHQRMLDALLAGGFALVREHPLNTIPIRVRYFLDEHVPPAVNSVDEARRWLTPPASAAFDRLLEDAQVIADMGDVVDVVRGWQRAGIIGDGREAMPHLSAVAFDSLETLREHVVTFVSDEPARRRIADDQRTSVAGRLTYVSALGRAMNLVRERLRETLATPATIKTTAEAA